MLYGGLAPIGGRYEPASEEDLARAEKLLGRKLPADYRAFLLRYGRCTFVGEGWVMVDTERYPILMLFGGGSDVSSVCTQIESHEDLCECGIVPIADDLFNNLYVLDTRTEEVSRLEYSGGETVARRVAKGFSEFLDRIEVEPD